MQDSNQHQDSAGMQTMTDGLDDLSTAPRNVLVLAPTHGAQWRDACAHFHTSHADSGAHILVLSYVIGSRNYAERLSTELDSPKALAVVEATADASPRSIDVDYPLEVRHEAPADLTGLGIQCSEFLSRWHDSDDISVCLESITAMLQYVPLETAYRFLHVLTHRVSHANATAHYHMSPDAHSQKEIGTIKQLFDAVATFDEETKTWDVVER